MAYNKVKLDLSLLYLGNYFTVPHMNVLSKKEMSKKAFCLKAERYGKAMAHLSNARIGELLPMISMLPTAADSLLDIFSGTGFVSDYFGEYFQDVTLMDQVKEVLPLPTLNRHIICGNALLDTDIERLSDSYRAAINLGALHHILPENQEQSTREDITSLRKNALRRWRKFLKPGGRLIIADVPSVGEIPVPVISLLQQTSEIPKRLQQAVSGVLCDKDNFEFDGHSDPEPAKFFDEFVSSYCPYGHQAYFESSSGLVQIMRESGFHNIHATVVVTPWRFRTFGDAIWFFHELFAIGEDTYQTPADLPDANVTLVESALKKYLGIYKSGRGQYTVGWKLLYVWGDNVV